MISNLPDRIFLSGFMGAGKSTIGRELAGKLERTFLDLDDYIEHKAGKSISEIFEEGGEDAFRKIERECILELIRTYEGIIALGGGSLHNQHMLDHIKLNGLLVFIETPISVILDRIDKDLNRPLLLNEEGKVKERETLERELSALYKKRLPLYQQSELTVSDDGEKTLETLVEQLTNKIKYHVSHY
ncbi:shikimate kinase [Balneolaceae bacterium YR4-1]|uniref:Shikimate kinase n=1 Tax=Halalkalibaculum roseum TaxID=2709311 RepID=A0A6M1T4F2_9BACT|nr:shikimate kinase [Halalkalibaculum roseum]NGP76875.1 shikimate kinase [Halalkalibaculum roseum]